MSTLTHRPTTPGQRNLIKTDRSNLHKGAPEKSLLKPGHVKRQGRSSSGQITVRHRGGGVKKRLRVIDFRRSKRDIPAKVVRFEYDPTRSANLALLQYADGEKTYILAADGVSVGDTLTAGEHVDIRPGNALPLSMIPVGVAIHCLELKPNKGAQMVRGAGNSATIQSKEGTQVTVQLPSKELRMVDGRCMATIGSVGNAEWKNRKLGKAGRSRLLGIRPTVRGTAQHPGSHPHGGGEGRSGVGMKYPKTPWGKHALGTKTRNKRKWSNRWIVQDRRSKSTAG